jgi:hypothetical protein
MPTSPAQSVNALAALDSRFFLLTQFSLFGLQWGQTARQGRRRLGICFWRERLEATFGGEGGERGEIIRFAGTT